MKILQTPPSKKEYSLELFKIIHNQYENISLEARIQENNQVARTIVDSILDPKIISIIENDEQFSEVIISTEISLFQDNIEKKTSIRFYLINNVEHIFDYYTVYPSLKPDEIFYDKFVNSLLLRINKMIIDKNDSDLFKKEVDTFSYHFIEDPSSISDLLTSSLFLYEVFFDTPESETIRKQFELKRDNLEFFTNFKILNNYSSFQSFIKKLEDYQHFLTTTDPYRHSTDIDEKILQIKRNAYKFLFNLKLFRAFFLIGAYALKVSDRDNQNNLEFIYELWFHSKPNDGPIIKITSNNMPISFDPLWLTQLFIYSGNNTPIWVDSSFNDEIFDDSSKSIFQYYLLCITRSVKLNKKIVLPDHSKFQKLSNEGDFDKLGEYYSFIYDYISYKARFDETCNNLIETHLKYESLFDNDAKKAFTKTKEWLLTQMAIFEKTKDQLVDLLPVKSIKIDQFRDEIIEAYRQRNELHKCVTFELFDPIKHADVEFFQIEFRTLLLKEWFIEQNTSSVIGIDQFGETIAYGELNYFIETVCENPLVDTLELEYDDNIFENLKEFIIKKGNEGIVFSSVLLPYPIVRKIPFGAYKKGWLIISDSIELEVIKSSIPHHFDDIIILDKNAMKWIYKNDEKSQNNLNITFERFEKDPIKIDFTVKSVVNCAILNLENIKRIVVKGMDEKTQIRKNN